MRVKMEYFDFVGFQDSDSDNDLRIMSKHLYHNIITTMLMYM